MLMPAGRESGHVHHRKLAASTLSQPEACIMCKIKGTSHTNVRAAHQPQSLVKTQGLRGARASGAGPAAREPQFWRAVAIPGRYTISRVSTSQWPAEWRVRQATRRKARAAGGRRGGSFKLIQVTYDGGRCDACREGLRGDNDAENPGTTVATGNAPEPVAPSTSAAARPGWKGSPSVCASDTEPRPSVWPDA